MLVAKEKISGSAVVTAGCRIVARGMGVMSLLFLLQSCASTDALYAEYDQLACPVPASNGVGRNRVSGMADDAISVWDPVVFFDYKKTELDAVAIAALDNDLAILQSYPQLRVIVRGSADSRGGDRYNLDLSRQRVDNVVNYLTSKGLALSRIDSVALGARIAGTPELPEQAHALFRRAELVLLDAQGKPLSDGLHNGVFTTRLNRSGLQRNDPTGAQTR